MNVDGVKENGFSAIQEEFLQCGNCKRKVDEFSFKELKVLECCGHNLCLKCFNSLVKTYICNQLTHI